MGVPVSGEECLAALGDELFFRAESTGAGSELWRTDGTAAGTRLAVDVVPGPEGSRPGCASVVGGRLLFPANTPDGRRDFWTSDGTAAGTVALGIWRTVRAYGIWTDSALSDRALAGGRLFFPSDDGDHGAELWVTDGLAAGTSLVADIRNGPDGSGPFQLAAVGNRVFFSADDGVHGRELWTSDGTTGGTRLASDLFPGGDSSEPSIRGVTDELVFFTGRWRRVGSEVSVALFCVGPRRGVVRVLDGGSFRGGSVGGRFLFLRQDAAGDGVWASDGTPAGTVRVASVPVWMDPVVAAGRLFFAGQDVEHGFELWASDGSAGGTRIVQDILPGPESSFPFNPTSLGPLVAFEARDGPYTTPWLSDGTPEGTRAAAALGRMVSPSAFTRAGRHVYFVDSGRLFVLTEPFD